MTTVTAAALCNSLSAEMCCVCQLPCQQSWLKGVQNIDRSKVQVGVQEEATYVPQSETDGAFLPNIYKKMNTRLLAEEIHALASLEGPERDPLRLGLGGHVPHAGVEALDVHLRRRKNG